jgi:fibronectin type 3 domain-containing protein
VNRSLFRQEFYNIVRWEPNPYNSEFEITEYRIYLDRLGEHEFLSTVPANIFEYRDLVAEGTLKKSYALTSVDSRGNESPKSAPVSEN